VSTATRTLRRGHAATRTRRADAVPKVTGEFAYSSDLHAAGMLWGQTVRSPHAHAHVVAIDTTEARTMPGVHAVLTHEDVPGAKTYGLEFADQPVLAIDRVRYFGEAVAIVAAEEPEQARRAAAAVRVEYEPLVPVTDPERATEMEPLHSDRPTMGHGYRDDPRPNVVRAMVVTRGEPDAEGDVSVEGVYDVGQQDQAFLGPESGIAIPDGEGGVDIHVATQWLHVDRDQVAPCLDLEPEQVRIHLAGVGGAFGGREDLSMQIHAALLALRTGRPVKIVYNREESFVGHIHRHPARVWAEHRATREGRLVAVRMRILVDGGAYASSSTAVISNACSFAVGPYAVENVRIDGLAVYTNNPPCGAMRGFGAVQTCFATEAQMDRLAAALGVDPVDLRARNALRNGDRIITDQPVEGSAPVADIIARCAALPLPDARTSDDPLQLPGGAGNLTHGEGVRRGVGFAVGIKNVCYSHEFDDFSTARVRVELDGEGAVVRVHTAASEVGQGIVLVCEQIARTELGVQRVIVETPDTTIGSAGSSSASRQTWMTGGAVLAACREAKAELASRAGRRGLRVDQVDIRELLDTPVEHLVTHRHRPTEKRNDTTQNDGHVAFLFAAHRAVVDVDVDTGLVKVVQVATSQDVGKAINPLAVIGQLEGGIAQGLGLAVMEEVQLKDGAVRNASFTDYLLPTMLDMPPVICDLIEFPHPDAPYGAKGVGEPPTISSTPAIVAAIRAATGRALERVPVRPDDIVFGVPSRSGWVVMPGNDPRGAVRTP
jgi:xanthine dehydrogenase D subunit